MAAEAGAGPVQVLRSRPVRFSRSVEATLVRERESSSRREASPAPDFTLNLFPDTNLDVSVGRVEATRDGKGWTVFGTVGQPALGRAILTFYGGALSGSVRLSNGEFYEVLVPSEGDGEVRQSLFVGHAPGTTDAVPVPLDEVAGTAASISSGGVRGTVYPAAPVRESGGTAELDILVLYTARAAEARGGTNAMLAHINQVFAESNQSLSNSEAPVTFRLVRTAQVNYDDSTVAPDSSGYEVVLNALRSATDGQMDEAHTLRNQHGADLVSLWLSPPKSGAGGFVVGKAYLMTQNTNVAGYANFAFSTVDVDYAGGVSMTFPHEIGHNLGCAHDKNNTTVSGVYSDSYGYQQDLISPKFFTIMAYAVGCQNCTRIDHFSNPNVDYQGIPTGVSGQINNVRALAYTAPIAANWRATATGTGCSYSVSPTTVSMPPAGGGATLTVTAGAECSWTAASTANWVSITMGASGSGDGSITLAVTPNSFSAPRSTILTVAGLGVTVNQSSTVTLPVLSVSPSAVSWTAEAGSDEAIATEFSFSTGSASSNIQLSSVLPAWLRLSETEFRSPAKIAAWVDRAAIAPGNYTTTLRFAASGTQNPVVEIPVTLSVKTGRYLLASAGASFRVAQGAVFDAQRFRVKPPIGVKTPPALRVSGGAWLSASVSAVGDLFELQVQVAPGGLSAGVYDGRVELSCSTGVCEIGSLPVRLEVAPAPAASSNPAAPRIGSGGVVNGASFEQGITPGAWMSLFGTGLAGTTRLWNSQDFNGNLFPLELDGVRVRVDGLPAPVQFISPGQVNFQAPTMLRTGWLLVDIVTPAGNDRLYVYSAAALPGFFQFHVDGQLAALHPDGTPVTARGGAGAVQGRPAAAGTVIAVYGTGFGPTNPPVPSGQVFTGAAPLVNAPALRVTVGGVSALVEFAGLSAAGLNQLNVKVPALEPGLKEVFASLDGVPAQFLGKIAVE